MVDYIVWHTFGSLLQERFQQVARHIAAGKFDEASAVVKGVMTWRVLDPACGSGSFLIKCYDYFADFYRKFNRELNRSGRAQASAHILQDFERHILTEQIHGVDNDPQAVEIAGVN